MFYNIIYICAPDLLNITEIDHKSYPLTLPQFINIKHSCKKNIIQ